MKRVFLLLALLMSIISTASVSSEEMKSGKGENASNPLAAVNNTDIKYQYFDLDGPERNDFWVDGAYMLHPKLKVKYELHYWDTDVTGSSESDFESLRLMAIYFPTQGKWGEVKYRVGTGLQLILDFDNVDKGIGSGSDQIAPFAAIAIMPGGGLVLIPLVQHFADYDGPDVSQTAFRMIAIQSLPNKFLVKLDAIVPIDWEHDNAVPATANFQLGKMFSPAFGAFIDSFAGVGADRPYEWGAGVGIRLMY